MVTHGGGNQLHVLTIKKSSTVESEELSVRIHDVLTKVIRQFVIVKTN